MLSPVPVSSASATLLSARGFKAVRVAAAVVFHAAVRAYPCQAEVARGQLFKIGRAHILYRGGGQRKLALKAPAFHRAEVFIQRAHYHRGACEQRDRRCQHYRAEYFPRHVPASSL